MIEDLSRRLYQSFQEWRIRTTIVNSDMEADPHE